MRSNGVATSVVEREVAAAGVGDGVNGRLRMYGGASMP